MVDLNETQSTGIWVNSDQNLPESIGPTNPIAEYTARLVNLGLSPIIWCFHLVELLSLQWLGDSVLDPP